MLLLYSHENNNEKISARFERVEQNRIIHSGGAQAMSFCRRYNEEKI